MFSQKPSAEVKFSNDFLRALDSKVAGQTRDLDLQEFKLILSFM